MSSKEYLLLLGHRARKRHIHYIEKGKVIHFMVQLEIEHKQLWIPVVRYDTAHNLTHIDRYNLKGEQRKESLEMSFDEALNLGDEDINENWEKYKNRFLKGLYP